MAEELRLALILLGALAIGSVILHGIWTVRRTVNAERKAAKKEAELEEPQIAPEEQEVQKLKLKQMEMNFATLSEAKQDGSGIPVMSMDVDSIYGAGEQDSATDTVTAEIDNSLIEPSETQGISQAEAIHQEQVLDPNTNKDQQSMFINDDLDIDDDMPKFSTHEVDDDAHNVQFNVDSADEHSFDDAPSISTAADDEVVSQVETNDLNTFENKPEPSSSQTQEPQAAKNTQPTEPEKQEVLMLFVDKSEGLPIDGAKLLPTLLTLGFKFGDMDLFHRHQNSSGQGEILFSLANMFNPGTFDIDQMEQVTTRGLTIFMTLPNAAEPLQTFNMMHNAAKKIADEFGANVLDDQRRPLDVAVVRAYVERIRKF